CFVAGTLVHTPNGLQAIETLKIGDEVFAFDEESGQKVTRKVTETFINQTTTILKITDSKGEVIETTWNHPFYIAAGMWVKAKDLMVGDEFLTIDGKEIKVASIQESIRDEKVYNLEVEDAHTYYVGKDGVLVHNAENYASKNDYQALNKEFGFENGKKTYVDENGHTVTVSSLGGNGLLEVVDLGNGKTLQKWTEIDEYGMVRYKEINADNKVIENRVQYSPDSIGENLLETLGHLTTGLPATIVGGASALLDLTLGNAVVGIHNLFTDDKGDWNYAKAHLGGPNGENDFIGIENSMFPALFGSRGKSWDGWWAICFL
ncbi:polymorphic toxin-type HINT domain-containing protein, partial [Leptospira licerasiae]|uniref:polymorphic toxin-type HINT domain-containing protein n=1 Tax=Leptospira licerasiae TaxID=447106 RepID=UPI001103DD58